jgi:hypothetical protein
MRKYSYAPIMEVGTQSAYKVFRASIVRCERLNLII